MSDIVIHNMRDGYVELVNFVRENGAHVRPRGYDTVEVQDVTFKVTDPLDCLPVGVGRKPKLAIGAAEALLLCGGIASPGLLTSVSPTFRRFMDGGDLHGGYGRRVGPQFARCAQRLLQDADTRQAVMTIWDPFYDGEDTRDLPCTIAMNFRIRAGKLNMGVVMRSNDVWLGTAYDVFVFTQLQATMANLLNIEVGFYSHHAWSLHAYARNADDMDKLHAFDYVEAAGDYQRANLANSNRPRGFGDGGGAFDLERILPGARWMQERARQIHDGQVPMNVSRSEQWYINVLEPFNRESATANFAS